MSRATLGWIVLGWVGFALLPWYGFERSAAPTLADYFVSGSALFHGFRGAWWLLPILVPLGMALVPVVRPTADSKGTWLVASGLLGLGLIVVQGFSIGLNGWTLDDPEEPLRRTGTAPGRHGLRRGADRDGVPDRSLSRSCRTGLVPWRQFRRLLHRHRHRADHRLRLLPGLHDPGERLCRQQRQLRAGGVRHEIPRQVDLGSRLPVERPALRRGLEHAVPRSARGRRHHGSGAGIRADRDAHRVPLQEAPARDERSAHHHPALRDRPRPDPALRPLWSLVRRAVGMVRRAALALDLRASRRAHRPAPRLHADRLPRPHRRRAGHQPDPGGSLADPACQELDDVLDRDVAAHAPGPRQCLPARLRGKPRRFRQPAGARRQLRGAVHQDLLRRRGRAAGPGPGRRALHHPARLYAGRLLAPARLARQEGLHDGDRQG